MAFHRLLAAIVLSLAVGIAIAAEGTVEKWDRDAGKSAPGLLAAGWLGTPVSLDAVKGNTVVLAFWNIDVPWC